MCSQMRISRSPMASEMNKHMSYRATYSRPGYFTPMSIDLFGELPGEIVDERRKDGLGCPGRSYHKTGMLFRCESQELRQARCQPVDRGEYGRVYGRSKLMLPFLEFSQSMRHGDQCGIAAHPSDPSTATFSESYLPCRFERLEELIGLEEGPNTQRIDDSKCD